MQSRMGTLPGLRQGCWSRVAGEARQWLVRGWSLGIDLTPALAERLRQEAERLRITPEELARAAVTDLLSERDHDFKIAAERVLEKYNELYRRLA
jgi:hypothetical protein